MVGAPAQDIALGRDRASVTAADGDRVRASGQLAQVGLGVEDLHRARTVDGAAVADFAEYVGTPAEQAIAQTRAGVLRARAGEQRAADHEIGRQQTQQSAGRARVAGARVAQLPEAVGAPSGRILGTLGAQDEAEVVAQRHRVIGRGGHFADQDWNRRALLRRVAELALRTIAPTPDRAVGLDAAHVPCARAQLGKADAADRRRSDGIGRAAIAELSRFVGAPAPGGAVAAQRTSELGTASHAVQVDALVVAGAVRDAGERPVVWAGIGVVRAQLSLLVRAPTSHAAFAVGIGNRKLRAAEVLARGDLSEKVAQPRSHVRTAAALARSGADQHRPCLFRVSEQR